MQAKLVGTCLVLLAVAQSLSTAAAASAPKLSTDDLDILGTSFSRGLARARRQQQTASVQAAAISEGVSAAEPPQVHTDNVKDLFQGSSGREASPAATKPEPTNKKRPGFLDDLLSKLEGDLEGQNTVPQQPVDKEEDHPAKSQPQQEQPQPQPQPQDAGPAAQPSPALASPVSDSNEPDSLRLEGDSLQQHIDDTAQPQAEQQEPLQASSLEQAAEHDNPFLEQPQAEDARPQDESPEQQRQQQDNGAADGSSTEQKVEDAAQGSSIEQHHGTAESAEHQHYTAEEAPEHTQHDDEGSSSADGYELSSEWIHSLLRSRHHSTPDHDTTEQAIDSPEHSQYDEAPEEAYGRLREPETDPEDEGSYNAAHKQPALEHRQKDADGPHYRLYAPEHHSSYPEHHSLYSEYDSHHPEYDSQDSEYEDAFEIDLYKPDVSYRGGPFEHVCMREASRSQCKETAGHGVTFTSSLVCCPKEEDEDRYEGSSHREHHHQGEHPDHYAKQLSPATWQQQSSSDQQKAASTLATGQQAAGRAAVQRAVREAPKIFFSRASTSECVWNVNYFEKVAVNEYTDQIGVATATCHFNASSAKCGSPLCDGMTITVQADVYVTTNALSTQGPSWPSATAPGLVPPCDATFDFGFNSGRRTAAPAPVSKAPPPETATAQRPRRPKPHPAPSAPPEQALNTSLPQPTVANSTTRLPQLTVVDSKTKPPQPTAADSVTKLPQPTAADGTPRLPQPTVVDSQTKLPQPTVADSLTKLQAPATASADAAQAPSDSHQPAAAAPQDPSEQPSPPTNPAFNTLPPMFTGFHHASGRHFSRLARLAPPAPANILEEQRAGFVETAGGASLPHDGPNTGDLLHRSHQVSASTGIYGGKATILTGSITSITGTEHHSVFYHRGLIEYVAAFQGRLLTADDLEDLPFDSPHVEGGAYKLVFMAEDH